MFVDVLVELKTKTIDQRFTYSVPTSLQKDIKVGIRVLVPFGKQKLEGFILKIKNFINVDFKVKPIIACIDKDPILNQELLQLGSYISKKTLSTEINAYQAMLPTALKAHKKITIPKKYETYVKLLVPYQEALHKCTSKKQEEVVKLINNGELLKREAMSVSSTSFQTLCKHNILKVYKKEVYRVKDTTDKSAPFHLLNQEQKVVVDTVLKEKKFHPFLLHGVTGSGKTEVYKHLISSVLKEGKEAIMLIPEISLTPQFVEIFKKSFKDKVAIFHSRLSPGEKYDEWRKIERKEVSIVIGARSAIFAPFTNLGIIILDEEHSSSYKQENMPKYHTIDVALFRGKYHNCPVILGSATPSIESYTRAQMGIYTLLEMKNRASGNLPKTYLVDMRDEIKNGNFIFSSLLLKKIKQCLDNKKQCILLLNRRGYATTLNCHYCGYIDKCPHCDIPLTFHKDKKMMRCHYCGYAKFKEERCPSCKQSDLDILGTGTQKIEEELSKIFKAAKILRMDADTTTGKNDYEKIVSDFKSHKYDILVGTQMIAKGLDFENVVLVGVLSADSSLHIPDFRSGERTYALLNQVAGRSGRSHHTGEVIFQGFNMDHYSIQLASKHDYKGFYQEEMRIRKILKYPPYLNLSTIEIRSKSEENAFNESEKICKFLRKNIQDTYILGPAPSLLPKRNDYFYFKIILKYKKIKMVRKSLIFLQEVYRKNQKVDIDIDINPNSV